MGGKQPDDVAEHVSGQSNKPMTAPAHSLTVQQVVDQLKADVEVGLSTDEAKRRLEESGRNEFGDQKGVQPIKIFIGQIANALTLVRSAAAAAAAAKADPAPLPRLGQLATAKRGAHN